MPAIKAIFNSYPSSIAATNPLNLSCFILKPSWNNKPSSTCHSMVCQLLIELFTWTAFKNVNKQKKKNVLSLKPSIHFRAVSSKLEIRNMLTPLNLIYWMNYKLNPMLIEEISSLARVMDDQWKTPVPRFIKWKVIRFILFKAASLAVDGPLDGGHSTGNPENPPHNRVNLGQFNYFPITVALENGGKRLVPYGLFCSKHLVTAAQQSHATSKPNNGFTWTGWWTYC